MLEELEEKNKDVSDQIADRIEGKAGKVFAWQEVRASQSPDTELKEGNEEDEKLRKSTPGLMDKEGTWLSTTFGTVPIVEEVEALS